MASLKERLHGSLSARTPVVRQRPIQTRPTMGYRTVGWVGWVTYDEAALVSLGGEEGKLALGLTGRHRSRLEAAEVTSQLLKMEHAGRHPLADRRSGTTIKHGQWPTTH